jgi:hypothetical protein
MKYRASLLSRSSFAVTVMAALFAGCALADGQSEFIVHSFASNGSQGNGPVGNLVADAAGNLYGVTVFGGAFNNGTVYELVRPTPPKSAWTETILYSCRRHPWRDAIRRTCF